MGVFFFSRVYLAFMELVIFFSNAFISGFKGGAVWDCDWCLSIDCNFILSLSTCFPSTCVCLFDSFNYLSSRGGGTQKYMASSGRFTNNHSLSPHSDTSRVTPSISAIGETN